MVKRNIRRFGWQTFVVWLGILLLGSFVLREPVQAAFLVAIEDDAAADPAKIITSDTGDVWINRTSNAAQKLWRVTRGAGKFVAVGDLGTIVTSEDGITWTPQNSGDPDSTLFGIAYGNGIFVAVGFDYFLGTGTVLTSPDAVTWAPQTSGTTSALFGVGSANGLFVAVGNNGTILTSLDGVTWTPQTSNTVEFLSTVTFGSGKIVVVGDQGTIVTSPDGLNWTPQTSGTNSFLWGVASQMGQTVAVGANGTILTSSDGTSWVGQNSGTLNDLFGVTFQKNIFVAVGDLGDHQDFPYRDNLDDSTFGNDGRAGWDRSRRIQNIFPPGGRVTSIFPGPTGPPWPLQYLSPPQA